MRLTHRHNTASKSVLPDAAKESKKAQYSAALRLRDHIIRRTLAWICCRERWEWEGGRCGKGATSGAQLADNPKTKRCSQGENTHKSFDSVLFVETSCTKLRSRIEENAQKNH